MCTVVVHEQVELFSAHLLAQVLDVHFEVHDVCAFLLHFQIHEPLCRGNSRHCSDIWLVEHKLINDHVFSALAPGLSLETDSTEASFILKQDFLSEGLRIGKLSENFPPVHFKSIFGTLRHSLPLNYLLTLYLVLLVQSAQTCY